MKYNNITKGIFIERTNRFCAKVNINDKILDAHVKNTGRLKELLISGATVYLTKSENTARKTAYDLVMVEKATATGKQLVCIDSHGANSTAAEWLRNCELFSECAIFNREVTHGRSRFDFYIEDGDRKIFLEVKGCTLEKDGVALFPDAPTERGVKHITELCEVQKEGFEAYILFVIQMKGVHLFSPNAKTHPEFARMLEYAAEHGVKIIAVDCSVTPDSVSADQLVPVKL